jgi:hypothetical protein
VIRVSFEASGAFVDTFKQYIEASAFPETSFQVFAFSHKNAFPATAANGWTVYDTHKEFTRQGLLPSSAWRVWNDNYTLVDTYPREFFLPAMMSESDIMEAARFRSKHRLPSVTWRNPTTGAILARSSQPMVGVSGHRCLADEKLLNLYRVRGDVNEPQEIDNPSDFYIFDARKPIAATGNQFQGKGVENDKNYENTTIVFCNIENIHTMRSSQAALVELLAPGTIADDDVKYMTKLDDTGWLRHTRRLLEGSLMLADKLQLEGASALVHCSDGWDRTSQLCATAQVSVILTVCGNSSILNTFNL